jgi:hypothetical protein
MTIIDDDFSPIAMADTGTPKEWTDEEVKAMFEEDEKRFQMLELGKQLSIVLHRAKMDILRREEEGGDHTVNLIGEKIRRGKPLSDQELSDVLFDQTNQLILNVITPKEYLRRMVTIAALVDLGEDLAATQE